MYKIGERKTNDHLNNITTKEMFIYICIVHGLSNEHVFDKGDPTSCSPSILFVSNIISMYSLQF